jgi:hypothetical protein
MATISEARALPFFTDLYGLPLESGFIYIGQPGLDPVAYPAVVTSDIAGSTVVAQPVRTTHGHAAVAGALIHLFCPVPYSITILDAAGRLVYASLNETDPVVVAIGSSSVQSAPDLAGLRARSGSATNQIWVTGFGMYVLNPTDTTSPESIPMLIVGNDGSRYNLSSQFVNAGWVKVTGVAIPSSQGGWLGTDGAGTTKLVNNPGATSGGFRLSVSSPDGTSETGIITISNSGAIATNGSIASQGAMTAGQNITTGAALVSTGGSVLLNAAANRGLVYSPGPDLYSLPSANLLVNGSVAMTQASLATNQTLFGVGSITLTNAGAPPANPGTWLALVTGLGPSGIALFVRTA